jgi:iron complex transport system ATP-binding protein
MLLEADSLTFAYGRRPVLEDVSFGLQRGEWLTVVGPNGAGKSTLLRCLLGLVRPQRGEVRVEGRPLFRLSRREIACRLALLPQSTEIPFGFRVREVVATGRTPHLGRFQPMSAADHALVDQALLATDTAELAERPVTQLSGGESQRVFLARAFAQDTPILVLDEPTTNLDLFHERTLLDQVRRRQEQGTAVLAVLHDLNLAARYANRVLVLSEGKVAALGTPEQIFTPELISNIFRVEPLIMRDPQSEQVRILV